MGKMLEQERWSDRRDQVIHCRNFNKSHEKNDNIPLTGEARLQRKGR